MKKLAKHQLADLFAKYSDDELEDMETKYLFTKAPPCFIEYQEIRITGSMITAEIKRRKSERTKQYLSNNIPIWVIIAIIFYCIGHFHN